uniref:Uncharacterized protein n=1 Tax=Anguilla anguilla TaxID=7936 RepID=A0A0E9QGX4_ANGAN
MSLKQWEGKHVLPYNTKPDYMINA